MPRRTRTRRPDLVWMSTRASQFTASGVPLANSLLSLAGSEEAFSFVRVVNQFIQEFTRPVTLLAAYCNDHIQTTQSATGVPTWFALGVAHGGQAGVSTLPRIGTNDRPGNFPMVVPITAGGIAESGSAHTALYNVTGESRAKRRLELGDTLYGSITHAISMSVDLRLLFKVD